MARRAARDPCGVGVLLLVTTLQRSSIWTLGCARNLTDWRRPLEELFCEELEIVEDRLPGLEEFARKVSRSQPGRGCGRSPTPSRSPAAPLRWPTCVSSRRRSLLRSLEKRARTSLPWTVGLPNVSHLACTRPHGEEPPPLAATSNPLEDGPTPLSETLLAPRIKTRH